MGYTKRSDGRKMDEIRPMRAEVGVVPNADGSALFATGGTVAIATVYGPKELHPANKRKQDRALIRCEYHMLPFSVSERARPGQNRRSKEIGMVTENALAAVVDLKKFPQSVIIDMKEMVASISIGKIDDKIVVDITKEEEDYEEGEGPTDIPFTLTSNGKECTHLQLDGKIQTHRFKEAIDAAVVACEKVLDVQKRALKGEIVNEGNK